MIASRGRKEGNSARRDHTRNCPKTPSQLFLKGGASRRIVSNTWQVHFKGEDTVDPKPEIHSLQAVVARQQRAGANQQCQRERELRGGQDVTKPSLRPCTGGSRLLTKGADGRDVTKTQRRRNAERDGCGHRDERSKSEDDRIESDVLQPRNGVLAKGLQHLDCGGGQSEPRQTTEAGKNEALDENLTHKPPSDQIPMQGEPRTRRRVLSSEPARGWRR